MSCLIARQSKVILLRFVISVIQFANNAICINVKGVYAHWRYCLTIINIFPYHFEQMKTTPLIVRTPVSMMVPSGIRKIKTTFSLER